ncbi:hypothetical protein [Nonomuraea sp. B5E05]
MMRGALTREIARQARLHVGHVSHDVLRRDPIGCGAKAVTLVAEL